MNSVNIMSSNPVPHIIIFLSFSLMFENYVI